MVYRSVRGSVFLFLLENQGNFVFADGLRLPQRAKMIDGGLGMLMEFFGFGDQGGEQGDEGSQQDPGRQCLGVKGFVQDEVVGKEGKAG